MRGLELYSSIKTLCQCKLLTDALEWIVRCSAAQRSMVEQTLYCLLPGFQQACKCDQVAEK